MVAQRQDPTNNPILTFEVFLLLCRLLTLDVLKKIKVTTYQIKVNIYFLVDKTQPNEQQITIS